MEVRLSARMLVLAMTFLVGGAARGWAGGAMAYEFGTPDVGLASAGFAARAQDAATLFTNPAGMTRLEGANLMTAIQALYGTTEFSPHANTTVSGNDGGNPIGWFPGGSLFYTRSVSPDVTVGVGTFSNFGLGIDYEDGWVGRYFVDEGVLIGLSLMPAIAYRVNPKFSVGGGLNAMYGVFKAVVEVNNALPSQGDGELEVEDRNWGFGGNFGALYEPCDKTRVGVTYATENQLDFSDQPKLTNLGPGLQAALQASGLLDSELGLEMSVPQTLMGSVYHSINDRWAVLGNLGWQDWSNFGKVGVEVRSDDPTSLTVDRKYKDTWQVAAGAQIRLSEPWLVSTGVAYDSDVVEDEDRTADMPLGSTWRFGGGVQHPINEKIEIGGAYTLAWAGRLPLDQTGGPLQGRVAGQYEGTALHFFAINLAWKL